MAAATPERSGSIRAQLERIDASPVFAHAGRMSRLLAYLVEAELAGDGARLNQSRIAIDAFGRNETFDPSVDSIVRVEIGRLRNKLREYYATDGREDAIVFELPKGRYRPSIRSGGAALARPPPSAALGAETAVQRDRSPRGRPLRHIAVAGVVSAVALIGIDGWLGLLDARSGPTHDAATATPREPSALDRWGTESPPTESPEAYALYLQAWEVLPNDPHALLDEALALDPAFALAHATKALFHSQSLTGTVFGPTADASDFARVELLVREHADRALSLDAAAPYAHIAVGNLNMYTWRWTEARRAFERAAATAPNEVALLQYAYLDSYSGRIEDAIARLEHLIDTNAPSPLLQGMLGLHQAYAKDYDAAAASLRAALSGVPQLNSSNLIARWWLAAVEISRGNPQAAVQELELIEQLSGATGDMLPSMAHGYARAGRAADARRLFDRFEHVAAKEDFGAGAWVEAYLAIGEHQKALQWLERAARKAAWHEPDAGFYSLMNLRMNVLADPVLDRPEFVAVLERIRGD
jgi:tetratricopeptide (TPR) repeat protein